MRQCYWYFYTSVRNYFTIKEAGSKVTDMQIHFACDNPICMFLRETERGGAIRKTTEKESTAYAQKLQNHVGCM